jgi:putative ubiquitin-RnfH superfamily antitoxin RatB of RatAB toxin-antitoxin module
MENQPIEAVATETNSAKQIKVEVAYATPTKQVIKCLTVPVTATVMEVIQQSQIEDEFPASTIISPNAPMVVGVFGKKIDPVTYKLQDQDRIEIYRRLRKSPNEKRLERAKNK